ncbi:MAG: cysteine hydrolase family protein [Solirubrobacterales bacterium]
MPAERIVFGREFFEIDPEKTAVIAVDMQNAFVAEEGAYETPKARDMMEQFSGIIGFARENDMPVIWTQSDHSAPHAGLLLQKFPIIRDERVLWKDEPSFELYPDMVQPIEGEHRVVKHKYDAFFETDLDAILRNLGVQTVVIVGTATNVCCESTARSAFFRDYQVAFISDSTASFDDSMHEATLKTIDMFFGRVLSTDELLSEMGEHRLPTEERVAAHA